MKLDGEKLLSDLESDLRFTNKTIKKIIDDQVYMANKLGHKVLLEMLIKSIKSGNYTINEE